MAEVCTNCKRMILEPVDHEFCEWRNAPAVNLSDMKTFLSKLRPKEIEPVEWGGESPHNYRTEPTPKQKPIKHEFAPKGAKPRHNPHPNELTDEEDSWQAYARKLSEGS